MTCIHRIALEQQLRSREILGTGALKSENSLLEIADREHGPNLVALCPCAAEKFLRQRPDDPPLRGIGVLRFIDQYMVDPLVQLVTYPFGDAGLLQQRGRTRDQVIEIDRAGQAFGGRIFAGIGAPGMKRLSEQRGVIGAQLERDQLAAPAVQPRRHLAIAVNRRHPAPGIDDVAIRLRPGAMQFDQARSAARRIERPPGGDAVAPFQPAPLAPIGIGAHDPVERPHIEYVVAALVGQPLVHVTIRQPQFGSDPWCNVGRQAAQRLAPCRTAHQKSFRAAFAQAQAERLERCHERVVALFLRAHHHVRQRLAGKGRLLALIQRPKARRQFSLQRKGCQQLLTKAMNRLNAQATGGLQHLGEQAPGMILHLRAMILTQRHQVCRQRGAIHLDPRRQPIMDAIGHFGRPRLGEGQAEDILRPHPLEQQAKYTRGKDMGLSRPRRCRQPHMGVRSGSPCLIAEQFLKRARLTHRRGHTIPPAASTGHNRHSWRLRD